MTTQVAFLGSVSAYGFCCLIVDDDFENQQWTDLRFYTRGYNPSRPWRIEDLRKFSIATKELARYKKVVLLHGREGSLYCEWREGIVHKASFAYHTITLCDWKVSDIRENREAETATLFLSYE